MYWTKSEVLEVDVQVDRWVNEVGLSNYLATGPFLRSWVMMFPIFASSAWTEKQARTLGATSVMWRDDLGGPLGGPGRRYPLLGSSAVKVSGRSPALRDA